MKGIVNVPLNIRTGKPEILGNNNPDFYLPGKEVEIVSVVIGDNYKGNNTWYQLANGTFVWSGGIDVSGIVRYDYKNDLQYLDKNSINTGGANATVVVIDTGVSSAKTPGKPLSLKEIDLTGDRLPDKDHGTFIAGIIAGQGEIRGIAPKVDVLSVRYKDDNNTLPQIFDNLALALEKVIELKENNTALSIIVNISQGFDVDQVAANTVRVDNITSLIKKLDSLNVVMLAAAGDNNDLKNVLFPARLSEVIGIGGITADFVAMNFPAEANIITPLRDLSSYNTSYDVVTDIGSSFSTAILSAIAALFASGKAASFSRTTLLTTLGTYNVPATGFDFLNNKLFQFFTQKTQS